MILGPIPAQAGEPRSRAASPSVSRAYPRAGGGTRSSPTATSTLKGLSPRRRGNHLARPELLLRHGPIPAQAGEPRRSRGGRGDTRAYPRAGGGTHSSHGGEGSGRGLSPRRRGNHVHRVDKQAADGPIPAQAGEPQRISNRRRSVRAYPRAGGGTRVSQCGSCGRLGLSPRRRGNPGQHRGDALCGGPIPAQAGEPRPRTRTPRRNWAYPRAGGGTGKTCGSPGAIRRAYPRAGGGTPCY